MIRNQWYGILESSEVKSGKPLGVTRMGERLVLWRTSGGELVCMIDLCAHRGAALNIGKVCQDTIRCPFHGLEYDTSGRCVLIPANGRAALVPSQFKVASYPLREVGGFIWLWWGEPRDDLPEVPFFRDLLFGFHYNTLRSHWAAHYSRAIENQLDVMHLPFVHYNTIGRGNYTLVDGPMTEWVDNELRVWVQNRIDDGTLPLRPDEVHPTRGPFLHLRMPNVWMNHISDNLRIVVVFAPIDEANTLMYVRFYQRVVRVPILRELFTFAGAKIGDRKILAQDRRVVITQRPLKSSLHMDEKLIQGDRPIIEYRRRRQALQELAQSSDLLGY
ncbi:MAG: aromatic ring-hydroxylating dioxygenase subunit alpha [Chloroflexi bacterium]|nr:aromatic ring-hydroxylating dioxygenase subunit alpha [Chloroflexota bacterium]